MVTASSLASPRDSSAWSTASASASSTSLPISVSKMTGTDCAASRVEASRKRRNRTTSSVLPDRQNAHFGAAAEANATDVADAPRHVDLARAPCLQARDVPLVPDGRISGPLKRYDHLPAVSVAAQHQVPGS